MLQLEWMCCRRSSFLQTILHSASRVQCGSHHRSGHMWFLGKPQSFTAATYFVLACVASLMIDWYGTVLYNLQQSQSFILAGRIRPGCTDPCGSTNRPFVLWAPYSAAVLCDGDVPIVYEPCPGVPCCCTWMAVLWCANMPAFWAWAVCEF